MVQLRPYQQEDVSAVIDAHATAQCVIGRAATGLGKAVEIAALAAHYSAVGRVMILVDVTKLVRQLAATVKWYTGAMPGIEMGEQQAVNGDGLLPADRIVVSTVQTQYSGSDGHERFRLFNPVDFSALLLDECELFLAEEARRVVEWYRTGNPSMRVYGCTATPLRSDGVAMAELFESVAFDRDITWGIGQGYLVPARQAFVRVSLDFSTLKVRKKPGSEDEPGDYSDAEIAERINNEATLVELAKGIIHVAESRRSIIVCPDVASAQAVAHYLDAERPGAARCVYGEMDDQAKDDVMNAHQRGEYQFLSSVMMLTKGYDDPGAEAVFICRKTRSRRLYCQIVGRVLRPAAIIAGPLGDATDADERRAMIAQSGKPESLVVNMVGIEDRVRDMTIHDILGIAKGDAVVERAKRLSEDDPDMTADEALRVAEIEVDEAREVYRLLAQAEAERLDEEDQLRVRRSFEIKADVDVEWQGQIGGGGISAGLSGITTGADGRLPQKQVNILRKAKVPEGTIASLSTAQASNLSREIVRRWRMGLCSFAQAKVLRNRGYSKEQLRGMTRDQASTALEAMFGKRRERGRE